MKKIKIGYDYTAEQRADFSKQRRKEILQDAEKYILSFRIPCNVSRMEKEGFVNYLHRLFAETYGNKYPMHLSTDERMKLANIDTKPLELMQREFDAHFNNVEDFSIYAETEEAIQRYNAANDLLLAFRNFQKVVTLNNSFSELKLVEATNFAINKANGELKVNIKGFVLNENLNTNIYQK